MVKIGFKKVNNIYNVHLSSFLFLEVKTYKALSALYPEMCGLCSPHISTVYGLGPESTSVIPSKACAAYFFCFLPQFPFASFSVSSCEKEGRGKGGQSIHLLNVLIFVSGQWPEYHSLF